MFGHGRLQKRTVCISNVAPAITSTCGPCHGKAIAISPAHWCRDTRWVVGTFTLAKAMQTEATVKLLAANFVRLVSTDPTEGDLVPFSSQALNRNKGLCTQQYIALVEVSSSVLVRVWRSLSLPPGHARFGNALSIVLEALPQARFGIIIANFSSIRITLHI